tara:strand:+ start:20895 stop:21266 length:372 start_codon:yes stop_codon:yes gene_type:complete
MTVLTEGRHSLEFLYSEAAGSRSRDNVTVVTGQNLTAGTVVGIVTASSKYAAYDNAAGDGTEVAAGILAYDTDATAADVAAVIIGRDAEVNADELNWGAQAQPAIDAGVADLAALGIIVRAGY